jgi:hypothetical protein
MPVPVISFRPEKTIDTYLSRWNAAGGKLPVMYGIENTKWPINTEDEEYPMTGTQDLNGYAYILTSEDPLPSFNVGDYVFVDGAVYSGVYQIRSVEEFGFVLNTAYISTDSGTFQKYYNNYSNLVRVYVGIYPEHQDASDDPIELVSTLEIRPNENNLVLADIKQIVQTKLRTLNDLNLVAGQNDLNLWTSFYISWAERYDGSADGEVVNFISSFTDDTEGIYEDIVYCLGSYSALQLRSANGGNMYDYIADTTKTPPAVWLTQFTRPRLFLNRYFDVAVILNSTPDDCTVIEYDQNGNVLATTPVVIGDSDIGVYRIDPTISFNTSTKYFTLQMDNDLTELLTIDLDQQCTPQDISLGWLNTLGGWEHWTFTAKKTYGYEVSALSTMQKDIFQNWDTDFIDLQSDSEDLELEVFQVVTVRSQNLTAAQVQAIARIKTSIKVVDETDVLNVVGVKIDRGSFQYFTDSQGINSLEFNIRYFRIQTQEQ